MREAEERLLELAYEAGQAGLPLDELKKTLENPEESAEGASA